MTIATATTPRKFEISDFLVKCSCEAHSTKVNLLEMDSQKKENFKSFITDNQTERFGKSFSLLPPEEKSEIIGKIHKAVDEWLSTKVKQEGIYQP